MDAVKSLLKLIFVRSFSVRGRATRLEFIAYYAAVFVVIMAVSLVFEDHLRLYPVYVGLAELLLSLLAIWVGFAASVRRMHDRSHSALIVIAVYLVQLCCVAFPLLENEPQSSMIPLLVLIVQLVSAWGLILYLALAKGMRADNQYGRIPAKYQADAADVKLYQAAVRSISVDRRAAGTAGTRPAAAFPQSPSSRRRAARRAAAAAAREGREENSAPPIIIAAAAPDAYQSASPAPARTAASSAAPDPYVSRFASRRAAPHLAAASAVRPAPAAAGAAPAAAAAPATAADTADLFGDSAAQEVEIHAVSSAPAAAAADHFPGEQAGLAGDDRIVEVPLYTTPEEAAVSDFESKAEATALAAEQGDAAGARAEHSATGKVVEDEPGYGLIVAPRPQHKPRASSISIRSASILNSRFKRPRSEAGRENMDLRSAYHEEAEAAEPAPSAVFAEPAEPVVPAAPKVEATPGKPSEPKPAFPHLKAAVVAAPAAPAPASTPAPAAAPVPAPAADTVDQAAPAAAAPAAQERMSPSAKRRQRRKLKAAAMAAAAAEAAAAGTQPQRSGADSGVVFVGAENAAGRREENDLTVRNENRPLAADLEEQIMAVRQKAARLRAAQLRTAEESRAEARAAASGPAPASAPATSSSSSYSAAAAVAAAAVAAANTAAATASAAAEEKETAGISVTATAAEPPRVEASPAAAPAQNAASAPHHFSRAKATVVSLKPQAPVRKDPVRSEEEVLSEHRRSILEKARQKEAQRQAEKSRAEKQAAENQARERRAQTAAAAATGRAESAAVQARGAAGQARTAAPKKAHHQRAAAAAGPQGQEVTPVVVEVSMPAASSAARHQNRKAAPRHHQAKAAPEQAADSAYGADNQIAAAEPIGPAKPSKFVFRAFTG